MYSTSLYEPHRTVSVPIVSYLAVFPNVKHFEWTSIDLHDSIQIDFDVDLEVLPCAPFLLLQAKSSTTWSHMEE